MKNRVLLSLFTVAILISAILSGCQSAGIPQAQYDQVAAQLKDFQSRLAAAQSDLTKAQADKSAVDAQLKNAQSQIASLQNQVSQSSLVGATPAETAAKIVKNYHDTHVYSAYDLFVCSDMAEEVWNMLKAQNISAVVVVGNVSTLISDILQSDHAWVLATVAPGQYLALEATGGYAVDKSKYPLYYVGWYFNSPADLKSHNDMVKEYNVRVGFRNQLNNEATKAAAANNGVLFNKMVELRTAQETELNNLMAKIKKLAVPLY
jgi:outer membrane murein-binding lipoprotein Lpp